MLQTIVIVSIALVALLLVAIGLYYSLQKQAEEREKKAIQLNSGIYSIVRVSPREALLKIKASEEEVEEWLEANRPMLPPEEIGRLVALWNEAIEHSIAMVEKGDLEQRDTFRYEVPSEEKGLLPFADPDGYITRETIYHHPELLPPFFIGSKTRLELKVADSTLLGSQAKSGWKPILPSSDGTYPIPDWKQLPPHLD